MKLRILRIDTEFSDGEISTRFRLQRRIFFVWFNVTKYRLKRMKNELMGPRTANRYKGEYVSSPKVDDILNEIKELENFKKRQAIEKKFPKEKKISVLTAKI